MQEHTLQLATMFSQCMEIFGAKSKQNENNKCIYYASLNEQERQEQ